MADGHSWTVTAPVWRAEDSSWHFATIPAGVSDEVDAAVGDLTGGFGSVRVEVTLGGSVWRTSLFPSREHAAYVLPMKKTVRTAEGVGEGDEVRLVLRLVDR
ncbi:DUF1905 domain-containing protein [Phycicoccus sp. BSK3Z-2]|uniref:DUF1905 domain-containing protein n=1 Tax=Phycicoccus avicenniae TaxID=2828860 RepID=A0A941D7P4_9MICO|nr:DUF1905 domain-containing protein [Phycicoccus avicenniae]MBR7743624.1 DUF1905 domain-containing protein [Phycicoccus avicenniae]